MKKNKKQRLREKLDDVFSKYIRLKAANVNGYCQCVTCGKWHYWTKIQNGHYMSRRFMATRFSEMNCHPQCVQCNVLQHGNIPQYRMWLVSHYGEDEVRALETAALTQTQKFTEFEFEEMIEYYKKLANALKQEKGL